VLFLRLSGRDEVWFGVLIPVILWRLLDRKPRNCLKVGNASLKLVKLRDLIPRLFMGRI